MCIKAVRVLLTRHWWVPEIPMPWQRQLYQYHRILPVCLSPWLHRRWSHVQWWVSFPFCISWFSLCWVSIYHTCIEYTCGRRGVLWSADSVVSRLPGCVTKWGSRSRAQNRCLLARTMCKSWQAAVRSRFTESVTRPRGLVPALLHTGHMGRNLAQSSQSAVAIYRPQKSLTPKEAQKHRCPPHAQVQSHQVRDSGRLNMLKQRSNSKQLLGSKDFFLDPPQFLRKDAQRCIFLNTKLLHRAAYRHNKTWWSKKNTRSFSSSFEADSAVDRNTRMPRNRQNVWHRGRRRNT